MADINKTISWESFLKCNESSAVDLLTFKDHPRSGPVPYPGCERETSEVNMHFQKAT